MSENLLNYCRLCAGINIASKLIQLDSIKPAENTIEEKLKKVNVDILEDGMPKTVCPGCLKELDRTVTFLDTVRQAQTTLRDRNNEIPVKKEKQSDNEEHSEDESKFEIELLDYDSEDDKPIITIKKRKKRAKLKYDPNETWKDYPWLCSRCNLQLPDIEALRQHSIQLHKQCCKYKCADCTKNKVFLNHIKFINHARSHRKHLESCCFVCNARFNNLKEHKHKTDLLCKVCGVSFDDELFYEDHMRCYSGKRKFDGEGNWNCSLCDKSFKCKSNLKVHFATHTERSRDFVCHRCGKTFYNKGALASHLDSHEDKRSFKCEICGHMFRTNAQLRLHVGIHGGVKPYSCEQCGRQFRLRSHLKSHLIIHTDAMPFVCSYCGKCFRFKTILTQHLRQHTGQKPYACAPCSKEFTNWPNYNKHMKRRHGIDTSKKKHTPDGIFPVNPVTGELQLPTNLPVETEAWKNKILTHRKPGRPKLKLKKEMIDSEVKVNDERAEGMNVETKVETQELKNEFNDDVCS